MLEPTFLFPQRPYWVSEPVREGSAKLILCSDILACIFRKRGLDSATENAVKIANCADGNVLRGLQEINRDNLDLTTQLHPLGKGDFRRTSSLERPSSGASYPNTL